MVTFVVLLMLAIGAGYLLVGLFRIVAEAFHDGLLWGLAVLLVPGGIVVYVLRRWAICQRGLKSLVTGGVVFGITWAVGVPELRARGDDIRIRKALTTTGKMATPPVQCDDDPKLDRGYAAYCCKREGWTLTGHVGCSATYLPREVCGPALYGQTRTTVCGTVGQTLKPVHPGLGP